METAEDAIKEYVYSLANGTDGRITERAVARHFNLKRNSAREALLALEGEGILRRLPKSGYRFVDYVNSDARTIYAVRHTVEREAARKALSNATREDILRMTLILEEMEEILKGQKGDNEVFYRADIEFHRALVSASHDNMLIKIFSFITAPVFRVATPLSELMPTHLDHRQILEAIKHADEKTLESHINRHLGNYDKTRGE